MLQDVPRSLRAIAAAVVIEAFESIEAGRAAGGDRRRPGALARMRTALWWVFSDRYDGAFAYSACCDLLGLNPERGREYVNRIMAGQASIIKARMWNVGIEKRPPVERESETGLYLTAKEHERFKEIMIQQLAMAARASVGPLPPSGASPSSLSPAGAGVGKFPSALEVAQ